MKHFGLIVGLTAGLALAPTIARAQQGPLPTPFVGENLLVTIPDRYKVDFTDKTAKASITEMVPQAETVHAWTEMVTVQIFFGLKLQPREFKARMEALWSQACANATSAPVAAATENGYPALVFLLSCPNNPQTGKPEWTWFKAVGGNDSFYVVQKAFKFEPSPEQIAKWMSYLKSVVVCDSRVTERDCKSARP